MAMVKFSNWLGFGFLPLLNLLLLLMATEVAIMQSRQLICLIVQSKREKANKFFCNRAIYLRTSEARPPKFFYTKQLLHPERLLYKIPFAPKIFYTVSFTPKAFDTKNTLYTKNIFFFLPATFYTKQLVHNDFYTKHFLHQMLFTADTFYTKHLLHATSFTPKTLYTKTLSSTFTPDTSYTRKLLERNNFYTTNTFTPVTFYTRQLLHQT